jgi:CheY-like chemotaxis protein
MPRGTETVLLVEDEDAVRALGRRVLAGCGYAVVEARDGAAAVRAVADHPGPIHLLVTDVVMPGGLGGRQVAEAVLARHPGAAVLYTSGYTADAVVRHGVEQASAHFLQKPFDPPALAHKVREVIDGPPADATE